MKKKFSVCLVLALLTVFAINAFTFAATPVKLTATIPKFKVTVNNQVIDNANNRYPLLVYKDITYFPMTWDYTRALGLKTTWDSVEGFSISKDSSAASSTEVKQDLGFSNNMNAANVVTLASFKIKVNGKEIDNKNEEYPLLLFRDITYFPMTWRFAVEEFGLKTHWDSVEGFSIGINTNTKQANGNSGRRLMEPSEIAEIAGPAVVYLEIYDKRDNLYSFGSGFIVDSTGIVVTNSHVIAGAHKVLVKLTDGRVFEVEKINAYDIDRDVAILKINGKDLPTVKLGNSSDIVLGQRVVAIGSPLGLENTISEGLVSSKNRVLDNYSFIQTTAPISPGSSGGALLNYYGEVIGITAQMFTYGQNLNLAIPINEVKGYISENKSITLAEFNKAIKQLYALSYEDFEMVLYLTASYMYVDGKYLIHYDDMLIEEVTDSKGETTLYLDYYVDPYYSDELFDAIDAGYRDTIVELFTYIADRLKDYYEKDVVLTVIYYDEMEKYPNGFQNNSLTSESTVEYNSDYKVWEVWFPVLEIRSRMSEEKFHHKWWDNK